MNKIACQCSMRCTAINHMECLHYQPSDNIEGETIPCIYHFEDKCINIIANQKALLESIGCLFDTMEETINAKQTAIEIYDEKREMQTA